MTLLNPIQTSRIHIAQTHLKRSGKVWFAIAGVGQLAFIGFILAYYGVRTAMGDYAGWNDKPLIDGHIEGDIGGNIIFAAHTLIAALMTLTGLFQLLPSMRRRVPRLHRLSGRIFLVTACFLALSGIGLAVFRGTYLSVVSAVAICINGVLILAFAAPTLCYAMQRKIAQHQLWAMRLFLAANGVWFLRVGLMGWAVLSQGTGMNRTLSGPADIVLVFGCYLIPLGVYELYRRAAQSTSMVLTYAATGVVGVASVFTALGVFGTISFMWLPVL